MQRRFSFTVLILLSPFLLTAQDGMMYTPGMETKQLSKVRARMEYFYNRVTYPNGTIPLGARARAFDYMTRNVALYAPSGKNGLQVTYEWRNVGPTNIGGRIFALAINPLNPNTIFVGAADGGIWRTYDEGKTWTSVSDELPTQSMGSIVINPLDTNIVYAGTGDASFGSRSFDGAGMFKSTDAGVTWTKVGDGTLPPSGRVSDMVIDPVNPSRLYCVIPDGVSTPDQMGLWRSTDAGATWNNILTGRMTDLAINPKDPNVLYTISSKMFGTTTAARYGVHKTMDGGDTWQKLDIGVADTLIGRTSIALCADQPDIVYIAVAEVTGEESTDLVGVFKSTNAGATWTRLPVPFDYIQPQGWFNNVVGVHPTNPDIVYAGGVKLLRSSDGGATWQRMPDQLAGGILHVDQHEIEFSPADPDRVFIGNDGGLYLSTQQGKVFEKRDIGLSITQFIGGAMHPSTDAVLFGGSQDNGTKISFAGPEFEQVLYGDGGIGLINPQRPNIMFTTQERVKLWRSDDFGRTWSWAVGNMPNDQSLFYVPYDMSSSDPSTLYFGTYRMYKTTDEGRNWQQLQNCLFPVGTSCYFITSVSTAPYDGSMVLAGAPGSIALSMNSGASWALRGTGQLPVATCSAVRTFTPGTIYATFSRYGVGKVWKSGDYGNTWTDLTGNLPDIPVNDIIELDGKLIIGTDLGAFISESGQWQRFGTGLPTVSVQKLQYNSNTGTLRAITHGRGFYDLTWNTPAPSLPVFVSRPDTGTYMPGQPFTYAPVVKGSPAPTFRLLDAPSRATIDPATGCVRWDASDLVARFTVEATNTVGSSAQTFSVYTADVITTDWEIVSSKQTNTAVNSMVAASDRSLWMARDTGWVSRSTDNGHNWQHFKLPTDASVIGLYAFDALRAVAGTGGPQSLVNTGSGHLWLTNDGGATWTASYYGIDSRFGNIHFWDSFNGIAVSQGAKNVADIFFSSDGGASWTRQQGPQARIPLYSTMYFADRMTGWFASSNEYASPAGDASVMRTTDGGQTWIERGAGINIRYVNGISFMNKDRGWLVEEMSGKVRRTANGGQSWTSTFYPMIGLRNVALHADPSSGRLWILSDTSAWITPNEGATWTSTQLIPAGSMQSLAFADSAHIWAVTKTGIVQRYIPRPVTSVSRPASPSDMWLGTGYPNPVSSSLPAYFIPFTLQSRTHVTLKIHNTIGRELTTIVDGVFPSGEHIAAWDATGMSPGVYFYTLTGGSSRLTGRVVVK